MKVLVRITDGKRTYEENVTEEEQKYFKEISTNGANPEIEKMSFEHWTRPIKEDLMDNQSLDKYNTCDQNAHFIFGWMECFSQSDNVPQWIYEAKHLSIEVKNVKSQDRK